jgi:RNA polymerase sigma-70 factor (ECF subfamily)
MKVIFVLTTRAGWHTIFAPVMKQPDDASLIEQIARAQMDAFAELYDRYHRLVFSVAYAILGDRAVAEEVTLDVFVRVWQRAQTYQPERGKVSTWLVAITRHKAIDLLRWKKLRPESNSLDWDVSSLQNGFTLHDPEEQAELAQQRERVRQALAQLPADQRQALSLAYFRGYSQLQIAEALKEPLGTVKTRIRLGMQKLRELLKEN